jgi:hypothetical protein
MKFIDEVEGYVSGQFNLIKNFVSLIKLEARLAGLTIVPLIVNVMMICIIIITLWLSFMTLLGYLIIVTLNNYWLAIGSIVLVNLLMLGGLIKYLTYNLKAMSFEKTRNYLSHKESPTHEPLKKPVDSSD